MILIRIKGSQCVGWETHIGEIRELRTWNVAIRLRIGWGLIGQRYRWSVALGAIGHNDRAQSISSCCGARVFCNNKDNPICVRRVASNCRVMQLLPDLLFSGDAT